MDSGFNINSLTNFAPCCFVLQAETAGGRNSKVVLYG